MDNTCCVYKHTAPNGKVYIGITKKKPEERWLNGRGYIGNQHFYNAIKKYGWANIKHEILCRGQTREQACELEKEYIALFDSANPKHGYNKTYGGEIGSKPTPETIAKTTGANNARARAVLQYDLSGKLLRRYDCATEAARETDTHISRIADCANGNRFSSNGYIWLYEDDSLKEAKLQEKIKEKRHPSAMCGGANHQARRVEQYTLDGEYIRTFSSAQTAADATGIDYSTIKSCAGNHARSKSAGGYIWINADEPDKQRAIKQRVNKGSERPVSQYSIDGKHIRDFASIQDAKSFLNTRANIGAVCRGERKSACGYFWKYTGKIEFGSGVML
jgi:hypothetical protein